MLKRNIPAFTLAELLISLAILGVIATFTIPKILISGRDGRYNAAAKEVASAVSAAYQRYRMENVVSSGTRFADLTPYLNYVRIDTSSLIDEKQTLTSLSCNGGVNSGCLVLHGGGVLFYPSSTFAGTASTNALQFYYDPQPGYSGTTDGPEKSVHFFLYYGGRLTTRGTSEPNTVAAGSTYASPNPAYDPPWFSW